MNLSSRDVSYNTVMDPFWGKWAFSIIIGGTWITLTTVVAERFGPLLGGLIGGVPSTALFTYLFIALTQTTNQAVLATTTVPMTVGLYSFFFLVYLYAAARTSFRNALFFAFLTWCFGAFISAIINIESFGVSFGIWLLCAAGTITAAARYFDLKPVTKRRVIYTPGIIIQRALVSGIVISIGVLAAKLFGPVWGGIFSTFPALTLSTLIITYRTNGFAFTRHLAKSMMTSMIINLGLYAIFVRIGYQNFGPWIGTLTAFAGILIVTFFLYKISRRNS